MRGRAARPFTVAPGVIEDAVAAILVLGAKAMHEGLAESTLELSKVGMRHVHQASRIAEGARGAGDNPNTTTNTLPAEPCAYRPLPMVARL
jgi:hypothetical protein